MNPCPCGHLGDRQKECRCSSQLIRKYRAKTAALLPAAAAPQVLFAVAAMPTATGRPLRLRACFSRCGC
ncbi:ATP-binding protein, partial [Klebsiella aerogenes]|uniref:ATP-binding protein n=1 Tax=Klebsiella aerogenes TaxID=548 RepID=UPI0034DABB06